MSQHLLKCLLPFVFKAISELLSFVSIWYSATPHLRLGSFARGIGLDDRTV